MNQCQGIYRGIITRLGQNCPRSICFQSSRDEERELLALTLKVRLPEKESVQNKRRTTLKNLKYGQIRRAVGRSKQVNVFSLIHVEQASEKERENKELAGMFSCDMLKQSVICTGSN